MSYVQKSKAAKEARAKGQTVVVGGSKPSFAAKYAANRKIKKRGRWGKVKDAVAFTRKTAQYAGGSLPDLLAVPNVDRTAAQVNAICEHVRGVHFFAKLEEGLQLELCRHLDLHVAPKDTLVIREGKGPDPGQTTRGFYVLIEGKCEMTIG